MVHLIWEDKGHREEIILLRKLSTHQHQVLPEPVLVSDNMYAWPLTYALVRLQLVQGFWLYREIVPENIKLIWARGACWY